ncbi:MAG TPA: hypothetical protein DD730_16500 [Desulfosporosinus sp.]|nr:hypothetical protein [Desulfosporosinus sp.]
MITMIRPKGSIVIITSIGYLENYIDIIISLLVLGYKFIIEVYGGLYFILAKLFFDINHIDGFLVLHDIHYK